MISDSPFASLPEKSTFSASKPWTRRFAERRLSAATSDSALGEPLDRRRARLVEVRCRDVVDGEMDRSFAGGALDAAIGRERGAP